MNSFMKYYYNTMIFFHKLLRKKQAYNIYLFTFIVYESKCQGFDVHLEMNLVANIVNSIKSEEFFSEVLINYQPSSYPCVLNKVVSYSLYLLLRKFDCKPFAFFGKNSFWRP